MQDRFVIKEFYSINLHTLYVLYDRVTGVHYLATERDTYDFSSITPLLDENGKVVIKKCNL